MERQQQTDTTVLTHLQSALERALGEMERACMEVEKPGAGDRIQRAAQTFAGVAEVITRGMLGARGRTGVYQVADMLEAIAVAKGATDAACAGMLRAVQAEILKQLDAPAAQQLH